MAQHLTSTELMTSETYFLVYHIYLTAAVQLITPVLVLIPVNVFFIKFLYDSRRTRKPLMNMTELIVKLVANDPQVEVALSQVDFSWGNLGIYWVKLPGKWCLF